VVVLVVAVVVLVAVVVVVVVAVARTATAAVVLVAAEAHRDRRGLMADECLRRRGRRTGAGAVAAVYSGDQRQATPPFPSVCRLVEKYTMLIERHRQNQQNGLTASVRGGKPSKPVSSKSAVPSGPAIGDDDAAAWNRLLMDNGRGENVNDDDVNGNDVNGDDGYDDDDDDGGGCDRRFSCVSLGSIQAGTCTRDCCNRRRRRRCRLAVTAAAVVMVVGRGGDKLPVTTCSRLSTPARALILRNGGPSVSDDERFLFFHFPFRRFLSVIPSLMVFFTLLLFVYFTYLAGNAVESIVVHDGIARSIYRCSAFFHTRHPP